MIYLKELPGKGRALIAISFIKKGKLIESAPAICFSAKDREIIKGTTIFGHCFVKVDEYSQGHPCKGYVVFGLMSFCNHSNHPNSYVEWEETKRGVWANLISLYDIEAEGEITIYYTDINEYPNASDFIC